MGAPAKIVSTGSRASRLMSAMSTGGAAARAGRPGPRARVARPARSPRRVTTWTGRDRPRSVPRPPVVDLLGVRRDRPGRHDPHGAAQLHDVPDGLDHPAADLLGVRAMPELDVQGELVLVAVASHDSLPARHR